MQVYRAPQESYESLLQGAQSVVGSSDKIKLRNFELADNLGSLAISAVRVPISNLTDEKAHVAVGVFESNKSTVPNARLLSVIHEYVHTGLEGEYITGQFATLYINGKKDAVLGGRIKARITDELDIVRFQLTHFDKVFSLIHKSPIQEPSTDPRGSVFVAGLKGVLADMPAFKLLGNPAPTKAQKISDPRLKERLKTA